MVRAIYAAHVFSLSAVVSVRDRYIGFDFNDVPRSDLFKRKVRLVYIESQRIKHCVITAVAQYLLVKA